MDAGEFKQLIKDAHTHGIHDGLEAAIGTFTAFREKNRDPVYLPGLAVAIELMQQLKAVSPQPKIVKEKI